MLCVFLLNTMWLDLPDQDLYSFYTAVQQGTPGGWCACTSVLSTQFGVKKLCLTCEVLLHFDVCGFKFFHWLNLVNAALLEIVPQPQYQGYFKPVFVESVDSFRRRTSDGCRAVCMAAVTKWEWNCHRSELDAELKKILNIQKFEDWSLPECDAVFTGIYRRFVGIWRLGEVRE
jgi:hypothetical protein